ncbi:MAG: YdcF family protein [Syntrophales bacterium]|nr:YdcF family protein [Syntrophales bacterium]
MDLLFLAKKVITPLFYPLTLSLLFILFGMIFLFRKKPRRVGRFFLVVGFLILLLAGYFPLTNYLLDSLERRYPPIVEMRPDMARRIQYIVVLGGGVITDLSIPPSSRLSRDSLARLCEGIRLHRLLPGSKLVLSGGGVYQMEPEATVMARVAYALGVSKEAVIEERLSKDTDDQAREIKKIVGDGPFILVTSALHMPRSMLIFRKAGLSPVAAPTNYLSKHPERFIPRHFYPDPDSLEAAEKAIHEHLGILWIRVRMVTGF